MFQFLPRTHAFSRGADLWIVPEPEQSLFSKKISFFLNFILERSQKHSSELKGPMLIESSRHLPCKKILFLKTGENWLGEAHQTFAHLKKPKLRLMPPCSITKEELILNWPEESLPYFIQVVFEKTQN